MKFTLAFSLIFIVLSACQQMPDEQQDVVQYDVFEQMTVRAMAVQDDETLWVGGPDGFYAYTQDGGLHWTTGKIKAAAGLEFRSIALPDSQTVCLLTAGSPALIFKTTDQGAHWETVFEDKDPAAFFNSMAFSDSQNGLAFGDVKDGCFNAIQTKDGGSTWTRIPCSVLPVARDGEVAFASSNTCIAIQGTQVWIGTGGQHARVLHSADFGLTWEANTTPMIQGNTMTGIYSVDFYDTQIGIVAGGDYEQQNNKQQNIALTTDGGASWKRVDHGSEPSYISCIQFAREGKGEILYAAGYGGLYRSKDQGKSWENLLKGDFTTLRESKGGNYLWYAGKGVLGKIKIK